MKFLSIVGVFYPIKNIQMIILTKKEQTILKDPWKHLHETDILRDLKNYWLINATFADNAWCIHACLNSTWTQFLRNKDQSWILDKVNVELNLGLVKISNK